MKYTEFTLIDYLFGSIWLLIFTIFVIYLREKNRNNPLYKFFYAAFAFKMGMGLLYAVIYVYVYAGGDTLAYWRGGDVLTKLFYDSPTSYFDEIWYSPRIKGIMPGCYNVNTGYPPTWIYYEHNSWFISKIASFFSFFTFGSYVTINLIFSFIGFYISFKFYLFIDKITNIKSNLILIATVFVPSVSFWCGGISKDTVVFSFTVLAFMYLWKMVYIKFNFTSLIIALISIYCILQTRPFIVMAIFLPLMILLVFRLNRHSSFITKLITRVVGITISLSLIVLFFAFSDLLGEFSTSNLIETAQTTYNDFQVNSIYTGKRYDLGITDFTNASLAKAAPLAVLTSIYRPFIWEAETVLMLLNGLESIFLLFMTFQLLRKKKSKYKVSQKQTSINRDFIIFSISFVLIMAFFVGLTSGLFGVLSRLKAPILPFFLLFLFNRIHKETIENDDTNKELVENTQQN